MSAPAVAGTGPVNENNPRPGPPRGIGLICVGTELLRGNLNTHQSYLAIKLAGAGLPLMEESSVPDEIGAVGRAISEMISRRQAVLVCGGLGPTFDDVTREAAAAALGLRLIYNPRLCALIRRRFARYRMAFSPRNKLQAFLLRGARAIKNSRGSAPGQRLEIRRGKEEARILVLLPGPFSEMSPMFEREILPLLKRRFAPKISAGHWVVHLSGLPESAADEKLSALTSRPDSATQFTILASAGQVDFHVAIKAPDPARLKKRWRAVRRRIYNKLGPYAFGEGEETLEMAVGRELRRRRLTLAVAESCTGGLLGGRLTAAAGSSDYFLGAVISYDNRVKTRLLGIGKRVLSRHGAVSSPCAVAMAQGVRRLIGADIGLSVTGIAGPSGGTPRKPVGLVYLGLSGPGRERLCRRFRFSGDRQTVRIKAVSWALHWLRQRLGTAS